MEKLVALTHSMDLGLRIKCIWALKNLVFRADLDVKKAVMKALTWDTLSNLINEPDVHIQEQALTILRNLLHGEVKHVEFAMRSAEKKIMTDLTSRLSSHHPPALLQAIYALCNIAASEEHKHLVMSPAIINNITVHMVCTGSQITHRTVFL